MLLAVLALVLAPASSWATGVVEVLARCATAGATESSGSLAQEHAVYLVESVLLGDGTRMELGFEAAERFKQNGLLAVQALSGLATVDCKLYFDLLVTMNAFSPCASVGGRATPRVPCLEFCHALWAECGSILALIDSVPELPLCGQEDRWGTFSPAFAVEVNMISMYNTVPEELLVRYSSCAKAQHSLQTNVTLMPFCAPSKSLTPQGTPLFSTAPTFAFGGEQVACTTLAEVNSMYSLALSTGNATSANCLSEEALNCTSPLVPSYADAECPSCDVGCPLVAFGGFMRAAEVYPAVVAIPLLLFLLALELRQALSKSGGGAPVSTSNPYIILCTTCGLVYTGLVVISMAPPSSGNGCNDAGAFAPKNPELWSSPAQQRVCRAMRMSVHVLQLLLCSMTCFVVHTYWKFKAAVSFSRAPRWRNQLLDTVLIVIVPGAAALVTLFWGNQKSEIFSDDYFGLDSVRYLVKCGPVFHSVQLEWVVVEAPMLLAIFTTLLAAGKLKRLCMNIVSVARASTTGSNVSSSQVRSMRRMGAQMHAFSVGCLVLLVVKTVSTAFLRTRFVEYVEDLNTYVSCEALDVLFKVGCDDPTAKDSALEAFALTANILSWSMIPPLFAAYFAGILMRRHSTSAKTKVQAAMRKTTSILVKANASAVSTVSTAPRPSGSNL